jgi:hypothetical protein
MWARTGVGFYLFICLIPKYKARLLNGVSIYRTRRGSWTSGVTRVNPLSCNCEGVIFSSRVSYSLHPSPESVQPLLFLSNLVLLMYIHSDLSTAAVVVVGVTVACAFVCSGTVVCGRYAGVAVLAGSALVACGATATGGLLCAWGAIIGV